MMVVTGPLDEAATLEALARSYGGMPPARAAAARRRRARARPAAQVRAELVRPVLADRLVVGFPAPGAGDPDRAAFEVVDEILAAARRRAFTARWSSTEVASSVGGDIAPTRDPCLFGIWVQMTKGHAAGRPRR